MTTLKQLLNLVKTSINFEVYDDGGTTILFDSANDSLPDMLNMGLLQALESEIQYISIANQPYTGLVLQIYIK